MNTMTAFGRKQPIESIMAIYKLTYAILPLIVVCGCTMWPIGEDPKGEILRVQADDIHRSILNYKAKTGMLPQKLLDLVPVYLDQLPEVADEMRYDKNVLIYTYSPSWPNPGQVSCQIMIGANNWSCHGYI